MNNITAPHQCRKHSFMIHIKTYIFDLHGKSYRQAERNCREIVVFLSKNNINSVNIFLLYNVRIELKKSNTYTFLCRSHLQHMSYSAHRTLCNSYGFISIERNMKAESEQKMPLRQD